MQAVELRLPGKYWDTFLYDGHLILFTREGEIHTYDWDRLVASFQVDVSARPLFRQFLTRGRAWYAPELRQLLNSPDLKRSIEAQVHVLSADWYQATATYLASARVARAESPAFPHTDVEAFYNTLFLSSSLGVHAVPLARGLHGGFDLRTDVPSLRLSAGYGSLAIAAGSEGVFEQQLVRARDWVWDETSEPLQLSDGLCVSCSRAGVDVIATAGADAGGYVAAFSSPSRGGEDEPRELLGVVPAGELFGATDGLLFGSADLLVMASQSEVLIDHWNPYRRRADFGIDLDRSLLGQTAMPRPRGARPAIDAAATVFGLVLEADGALQVLGVDGGTISLREPVAWRCFPRSQRYLNHLHVVYSDHVRIYAFVDDYFVPAAVRGPATKRPYRGLFAS